MGNIKNREPAIREEALKQVEEKSIKNQVLLKVVEICINKNVGDLYSLDELHNT